jgi:glycosyltransferase involved in cell wall biosynthesis
MNRPGIRVAHVITLSTPFGGAQRNTLLTVKGLVRDGYEVELICGPGGQLIPEAEAVGVPVHILGNLIRSLSPWKDICVFFNLYRLFRAGQYHIVHTHSVKAGLLGRIAAWLARVPIIVHTVHGVPYEINGDLKSRVFIILERVAGWVTDRLICVGEVLRQDWGFWKIAPDEKVTTVYSGIDFSSYCPSRSASDVKAELRLEESWPIVGSTGRLSRQKAQEYLVEAIALLKPRYPNIRLLLVGDGELRVFLEKRIHDLGVSSNVCVLGEREDVADLLNIFEIYAMSSRWEGIGRALTEAMYRGLPVVATSVNGVRELVIHEQTGLLVVPRDAKALAVAIDRLVSNADLARRLGQNAHRKVQASMDSEKMITAIEEIYERLALSKRDAHSPIGDRLPAPSNIENQRP